MEQKKPLIALAPLAGVSDRTMRALCMAFGADMCTTEMISAKAVFYKDRKTFDLARFGDGERPCAIQLFGSEPAVMAFAAEKMLAFSPCAIDVNMGCPVPKVVRCGEGSALMKDPPLAARIVSEIRRAVSPLPVTVKFRSGFDARHINAVEFAKTLEDAGADALCVHGRTREQMYAGASDPAVAARVKAAVRVPVIANGDVFTPEDAKALLDTTGCDGIAVARGALGAPFLFRQIREFLARGAYDVPDVRERIGLAERHVRMLIEDKGEKIGVHEARKHLGWYVKGMSGAATARGRINTAESFGELCAVLEDLEKSEK